jgi:23S rRNA (adenine2030-N6)-methyltransferase
MNYRHIFHAGNISDIVKHAVLVLAINHLRGKDAAFGLLDTHAGIGLYDLWDERAQKTGEAQNGIYRLLQAAPLPELADYYRILAALNPGWHAAQPETLAQFHFYPGSPMIAKHMLRAQDRLMLCEKHGEDIHELRRQFRGDKQVQIHHRDGYEALRAFLPLPEKRGLALIDPPYEDAGEFAHLATAIIETHKRWPQGMLLVWYPVKERPSIWRFHESLAAAALPKLLSAEFMFGEETRADRLQGCGLILVNPPWKMDDGLRQLFPALQKALQTGRRDMNVSWLADE